MNYFIYIYQRFCEASLDTSLYIPYTILNIYTAYVRVYLHNYLVNSNKLMGYNPLVNPRNTIHRLALNTVVALYTLHTCVVYAITSNYRIR